MRYIGTVSAFVLSSLSVFAQQYNINTVAGGSPLPNVPAASLNNSPIGNPSVLASDSSGNIYFISNQCVFRIDSNGMTRVAGNARVGFSGDGSAATSAQLNNPAGLAIDSANNLYIADTGNNRIRKVVITTNPATTIITTLAGLATPGYSGDGLAAAGAALNGPQGLAVDNVNNLLYIADTGNNAIRKITFASSIITTVAGNGTGMAGANGDGQSATGPNALLNAPTGVAVDPSGNIYIADSKNNRIREVSSNTLSTIAGTGIAGFTGDNNLATAAEFSLPTQVAYAPSGVIYILDSVNARVREILPNKVIMTLAGAGGTVPTSNPQGIATDPNSNLFIADDAIHAILKVTPAGGPSYIAGPYSVSYSSGDGGPATSAQLVQPEGLALDTGNNVYVADPLESRIRKFVAGGNISSLTPGGISGPAGVAVDSAGNVYIADASSNVVVKVISGGTTIPIAGNGTRGSLGDNQLATSVELNQPSAVAVDSNQNVYIADTGNHKIRKVTAATGFITTLAGNGSPGFLDSVVSAAGLLSSPSGLALNSAGDIFIADTGNNRIRKIAAASGSLTTVAGNGANVSSGDGGQATNASIAGPHAVAIDSLGNLYVPDSTGRVRKVSTGGIIATIAGNGTPGYSGDGGPATSAQLDTPWGVIVDPGGNVYVSDPGEQAVRILSPVASSPLSIQTTSPLTPGTVGVPYAQSLTAMGGAPPYSWSIVGGSLPTGLTLNPTSGLISGTPTGQSAIFIVQVTDFAGTTSPQVTFNLVINPAPTGLTITTTALVPGGVGIPYSQTLTAVLGNPPYNWSLVTPLPSPLVLSPGGVISGTPPAAGNFPFTVRVADITGTVASQTFTLQVLSFSTPSRSGVLGHIAAGATWTTRAYLTNISTSPIEVNLVIHTDDGSNLPINVTQQGPPQPNATNLFIGVMNPNTMIVIDAGAGLPNLETGWIDVLTSGATTNPLAGFAIFRATTNGAVSEGTTPLQTAFESKMDLQFDDTSGYNTDFAIANLSGTVATVTATVYDQNGSLLGTYPLPQQIAANGHAAYIIPTVFAAAAGKTGLIQFVSNVGNLAGVGLRANTATGTFTTVPVILP